MRAMYATIARHLGDKLGCQAEFFVGTSYAQLTADVDLAFLCGLAYVELTEKGLTSLEPLAAPVLEGERYGGKPVYYSDVIVRADSRFRSLEHLRGCSWSYNEPFSQSGYGVTRYQLALRGETTDFFGRVAASGYHQRSIRWVCQGRVDAAAIDSHVLAIVLRNNVELRSQVRVIESWGPSSIQPIVASRRLSQQFRLDLRSVLVNMIDEPSVGSLLSAGMVERFVPVSDTDYDDIRRMRDLSETATVGSCPSVAMPRARVGSPKR
jgi:phosphonate transport system substrate-binding protein